LYFVGAGTHPGAGIPGVVNSAKATFGVIAQDHLPEAQFEFPTVYDFQTAT
jgi:phytoene dehydrogenase-like protein